MIPITSQSPVRLSDATSLDSLKCTSSPAAGLPAIVIAALNAVMCISPCANQVSVTFFATPTAVSMASSFAKATAARSKSIVSVVSPAVLVQYNLNLTVPAFQFAGGVHVNHADSLVVVSNPA